MDEIDVAISMMLMNNSRISYSELADIFKISINSIHKRVKNLVEMGIIRKFTTYLNVNLINVIMCGVSKAENFEKINDKLGKNGFIYWVCQASGKFLLIGAFIRNLNELDAIVSFVRETCKIDDLFVGLDKSTSTIQMVNFENVQLTKLDYLIINSLKENSRKNVTDIADEIGASVKTIRKRLNNLLEKRLITFSIEWLPDKSHDVFSLIRVKLKPNVKIDNQSLREDLRKEYGQKIIIVWFFSNIPDQIFLFFWTSAMKELQELETSLSDKFESVNVNIIYKGDVYPTWRDRLLQEKLNEFNSNSH